MSDSSFQKENRYIVLKRKDLESLSPHTLAVLNSVLELVQHDLNSAGAPKREYVVVESDWIEYDVVWNMIQARMEKKAPPPVGWVRDLQGVVRTDPTIYSNWALRYGTPILPEQATHECWYFHTPTQKWCATSKGSSRLKDPIVRSFAWLKPNAYALNFGMLDQQP